MDAFPLQAHQFRITWRHTPRSPEGVLTVRLVLHSPATQHRRTDPEVTGHLRDWYLFLTGEAHGLNLENSRLKRRRCGLRSIDSSSGHYRPALKCPEN